MKHSKVCLCVHDCACVCARVCVTHLALVRFLQPAAEAYKAAFLQRCEVTQVTVDVVSIQFI